MADAQTRYTEGNLVSTSRRDQFPLGWLVPGRRVTSSTIPRPNGLPVRPLVLAVCGLLAIAAGGLAAYTGRLWWIVPAGLGVILLTYNIIKKPRFGLYLMVALIPVEAVFLFDETLTATKLVGLVTFVAWAVQVARGEIDRPRPQALAIYFGIALFVIYSVVSVLWAVDKSSALSRTFSYLQLGILVLLVASLLRNTDHWRNVAIALVGGGVAAAIYGVWLLSSMTIPERLGAGGLGNENWMALAFGSGVLFAWFGARIAATRVERVLWLGALCALVLAEVWTASLSGFVGMITAMMIVALFSLVKARRRLRLLLVLVIVLIIVPFAILAAEQVFPEVSLVSRYSDLVSRGFTKSRRSELWAAAFDAFLEKPILGYGAGQMRVHLAELHHELMAPYYNKRPAVHNVFLEIAGDFGIVGFGVFFVGILVPVLYGCISFVWSSSSSLEPRVSLLSACIVAFVALVLIMASFQPLETHKILWLAFGSATAIGVQARIDRDPGLLEAPRP